MRFCYAKTHPGALKMGSFWREGLPFWTQKKYSWGTTARFCADRPPMEGHYKGEHTGRRFVAIASRILRGHHRLGSKMLRKTASAQVNRNSVFDIPGAPMVRFGPSKVRSNRNHTQNARRDDSNGVSRLQTKLIHFHP